MDVHNYIGTPSDWSSQMAQRRTGAPAQRRNGGLTGVREPDREQREVAEAVWDGAGGQRAVVRELECFQIRHVADPRLAGGTERELARELVAVDEQELEVHQLPEAQRQRPAKSARVD